MVVVNQNKNIDRTHEIKRKINEMKSKMNLASH